jgi:hypothetical protein
LTPSTLFPSVGCIQKQEFKTWHIWIPMVISITKWESVGSRDARLLVWMWVPGTHLIGPFHFWDASRGDAGVYSIWQDIFSLPLPRIRYDSGLANFDFTEIHLQDMILDSGDDSSRHYNLGFVEWRM